MISDSTGLDDWDSLAVVELLRVPFPLFFTGMFGRSANARLTDNVVVFCFFGL